MNMEENMEIYRKPVFTKQWLCVRVLLVTGLSLFMTIVACGFDALALGRKEEFLLKKEVYILLTDSIDFCFALIFVTMMTLIVMEIRGVRYPNIPNRLLLRRFLFFARISVRDFAHDVK